MPDTKESMEENKRTKLNNIKCKHCGEKFSFKDRKEKSIWVKNQMPCKVCKITLCVLDSTERSLNLLQKSYIATRKDEYIVEMYKILVPYSKSLIRRLYSNVVRNDDDTEYYSHRAATLLIENYYRKPDFRIDTSFGGYLPWKIKEAIFHKNEHIIEDKSLNNDEISRHLSTDCNYLDSIKVANQMASLERHLTKMAQNYPERVYCSKPLSIKYRVAMKLKFHGGIGGGEYVLDDTKLDSLWGTWGKSGRAHFDHAILDMKNVLKSNAHSE